MILADFQRWYVALSTTETNQTVFDFLCKTTLQSIVFRAFLSWAWGHVYIFLQHQFVLAFILLFCLSKLWHAKAVSCQLDRTSEVNAFAYFQPVCLFQSAFFDVSFWKYSTFPHVISSQWFQSEHFPNYFHPNNHISIPVSAFPCPCCCIIWNTLYQHNHAPNTNIINGL